MKNKDNKFSNYVSEIDERIWLSYAQGIKTYKTIKRCFRKQENIPLKKKVALPIIDTEVTRASKQPQLIPNSSLEKGLVKRLRRGDINIDAKIDLHGYTQNDAHLSFNQLILQSIGLNRRCILVITGKGNSYLSQGILRQALPKWIAMPDIQPYILAYCHAAPKDGGSGAWYILLRKNK